MTRQLSTLSAKPLMMRGRIAPQVRNRTDAIEAARMNLASTVLRLAKNGTQDVQTLTDAAVQAMLDDPTKLGP
jgi:hypothetical protein